MILQSLLEDKRAEWQMKTQEEILKCLLCKVHMYKTFGKKEDRFVMVFGKSHAGKTSFILTLLGIKDETVLNEVDSILRAGVPEGCSSTSTAIIYQKSDDDMFGFCERGINDVAEPDICKCDKEQFIGQIKTVRSEVESGDRKNDNILYLYLPQFFFVEKDWQQGDISILDVPGYETRNEKERYHTDAILNKYMAISVLNIIVWSINDINDLQYFQAPNRDDVSKLTSGKYIIVTTRSYSAENVFKYFLKDKEERATSTFEEFLESECKKQFERIFGNRIPKVFPIDIGQSFDKLIESKINNDEDKKYLVSYRDSVLKKIIDCIYSKQANSLVSWVQEVIEDEDYYGNNEIKIIESEINETKKKLQNVYNRKEKRKEHIANLRKRLGENSQEIQRLKTLRSFCTAPKFGDIVEERIKEFREKCFTDRYEWEVSEKNKSVSAHIAQIYVSILMEILQNLESQEGLLDEKEKNEIIELIEEGEYLVREELEKSTNKHAILKVLNPSNKGKIDLGSQLLHTKIPEIGRSIYEQVNHKLDEMINDIESNEQKKLNILIKENEIKKRNYEAAIQKLLEKNSGLEEKKLLFESRIEQDKAILTEYRKIAKKCFNEQRNNIIDCINNASSKDIRLNYVLFLGLIANDYKKIMME